MNKNQSSSLLFLCLILLSGQLLAWNKLTNDLDISCQQIENSLDCEYRVLSQEPTTLPTISASSNNIELQVTEKGQYPEDHDVTAILFLIDTSDPARQNVIEKNKAQIKKILSSLKPHQKVGLASFDKSLKLQSPIGTSSFLLSKALNSLKASGRTTELYRNLLKAIKHLHSYEAKRKVIILLSDGQAEDKAYFHSDIIKISRKYGISINSIGYPRSVALSVALQTLRRLSEETGGSYIETDMEYNLPDSYLTRILNNIDSGSSFSVDLNKLSQRANPENLIKLTFKTNSGIKKISVPVAIKSENKIIPQTTIPAQKTAVVEQSYSEQNTFNNNLPIQIVTKQVATQPINLWLWYGLPAAFIIIIVFILITLFLLWRKPEQQATNSNSDYKPYAYLISNDSSETRYPITRTICRIGRSKDNELHLDDTSISRRHAEIHRNIDGSFDIVDMDSMNGVYINNEKIRKAEMHEGDIIEIGDFFLRFTQFASDHALEESTVMQKTRVPSTH